MPWEVIARQLGLGEGGLVRNGLQSLLALFGLDGSAVATPGQHRVVFTIAFVALAAKMAKSDGCVTRIESETFEKLYSVHPAEAVNVRHIFDLTGEDPAGYESYARQIARTLANEPRLLRDVFDALFHIAAADGVLHPGEDRFLRTVADIFGIGPVEFRAIRAAFVHDAGIGTTRSGDSPYEVMGATADMSDADLKALHRQLVREHHPDSLAARGVPAEFHAAASRKLAVINAAYDTIRRERGLKEPAAIESSAP
jgi:DnaJ like chaperone protein